MAYQSSMFDSYVDQADVTRESFEKSIAYLEGLQEALSKVHSIDDFSAALMKFMSDYSFSDEVIFLLSQICKGLSKDDSVYDACEYIVNTLREMVGQRGKESDYAEADLAGVRKEVVDHLEGQLNDVGVSVTGDYGELENQIQSTEDVERLRDNIDEVVDYLKEREKLIGENQTDVELSIDQVDDALQNPDSTTILEHVQTEENLLETETVDGMTVNENGEVVLSASQSKPESVDFAKMMMVGMMTHYATKEVSDSLFGMQLEKGEHSLDDFTVKFGINNFSKSFNGPMDVKVSNQIMEMAKQFRTETDYTALLANASPELSSMMQLFEKGMLGKEGMARLAVRHDGEQLGFAFQLGGQLNEVADALGTNGAPITQTPTGDYYCRFTEMAPGDTLNTMMLANETLSSLSNEETLGQAQEKTNTNVLVKTLDLPVGDRAALVNPYLLMIVSVLEALSILFVVLHLS